MTKKAKLAGLLAAMTVSVGAHAAVIDLFTQTQILAEDVTDGSFTPADSNFNQSVNAPATILDGYRDLVVSNLSGGDALVTGSSLNVTGGLLRFASDPGTIGQGQVQWDGDDSAIGANPIFDVNPIGLGGENLTLGGLTAFQLVTEFSDLGWVFELTMYKDGSNFTTVSLDASAVVLGSPTTTLIPFSAFSTPALCGTYGAAPGVNQITCVGTGADPTNVGALVATINTGDPFAPDGTGSAPQDRTVSVDLQLTSVTTVPEPSVLALVGLGLLGIGVSSRKARRQA